jgi:hypothetical protein
MLDLCPRAQYAEKRISELKVNYACEARRGLPAQLLLGAHEDEFCVRGIDSADTHTIFEAIGNWMPVK